MRRFTEEEIEELKQWELNFKTAVKSNYKRATIRKNDLRIREIAEAAGMENLTTNFGCGSCSLNFYRLVGIKYYEDKTYYEENKAGDEVITIIKDLASLEEEKPVKKKGGRPKKTK